MEQARPVSGWRLILGYLGVFLVFEGIVTLLPLSMLAFYWDEWRAFPAFLIPGLCAIAIGLALYFPFVLVGGLTVIFAEAGLLRLEADGFFWLVVRLTLLALWTIVYLLSPISLFNSGFDRSFLSMEESFDRWSLVNEAKMEDLYFRKVVRKKPLPFWRKKS